MASRCRSSAGAYRRMVASLEAWQHGIGNAARRVPVSLVELGVVLHYQEGWWFSSRMVHSSDGGEGPPHYQVHGAAIQPAEEGRADAGEDDPELMQVGVAVKGSGQYLLGGDKELRTSGCREKAGIGSIPCIECRSIGDLGGGEGRAKVRM
jgi:hypothetical protein